MMKVVQGYAQRDEDERMIRYFILTTLENFQRDPNFHRIIMFAALEKHEFGRLAKRVFGLPLAEFLLQLCSAAAKSGRIPKGRSSGSRILNHGASFAFRDGNAGFWRQACKGLESQPGRCIHTDPVDRTVFAKITGVTR